MDSLPIEIHRSIAEEATDLLSLRAVNRFYKNMATPLAFRSLNITNLLKNAEGLQKFQQSKDLCKYVEHINFNYVQRENIPHMKQEAHIAG